MLGRKLKVKVLDGGVPAYAHEGGAGLDLMAPEAKPEPAADVPHGLAGLRKLSEDMRDDGGLELWNFLYSGAESTCGEWEVRGTCDTSAYSAV